MVSGAVVIYKRKSAMKRILIKSSFQKALDRPLFAANYLKGKLKAKLGYRWGMGYALPPGRFFFALTARCNLTCKMCPQVNHPSLRQERDKKGEADIKELQKIIDDISPFRPIMMVSGGELFLHPSWFDFLSYIKAKRLYCSIGTNGTFLERDASELVNIGIDEISVSLDGPESIHDEIRGFPGTYAATTRGIQRLMEKRKGNRKPRINIIFTISSLNFQVLPEIVEQMEALKIDTLRISHLNFLSQKDFENHMHLFKRLFGIELDTSWEGFVSDLHHVDATPLAETIETLRRRRNGNLRITFFPDFRKEEIIQYYSHGSFSSESFRNACLAPWDLAIVGPGGELILCPNYIIGNLCEQRFQEIWNNEKARFFRKTLSKMQSFPVCSRGCCFFYV
jgi:MoaA/NifB/PqqE/SkfB family radical SAM enzyme